MNEDEIRQARELAAQLQAQAAELLKAAGVEPDPVVPVTTATVAPLAEARVIEDDDESAEREPLVQVDMRDELEKVRAMLPARGFVRKASSGDGEVWEKPGPRGEPGFKATLIADPHGRIRMEVRNPGGFVVGNAEPATELDCTIALQHVP